MSRSRPITTAGANQPTVNGRSVKKMSVATRADQPLSIKDVEIWPIPAAHDRLEDAEDGHRFQGYIVRLDGVTG